VDAMKITLTDKMATSSFHQAFGKHSHYIVFLSVFLGLIFWIQNGERISATKDYLAPDPEVFSYPELDFFETLRFATCTDIIKVVQSTYPAILEVHAIIVYGRPHGFFALSVALYWP
jgi:hypothetical protein